MATNTSPYPYLDAATLLHKLPMQAAIAAMRAAFGDDIQCPLRVQLGNCLFMPARVGRFTGIKVVSISPGNPVGTVTVFDAEGSPIGSVDGKPLTTLRTGAASGLATALLARPDAHTLAMLGAGATSFHQVEAVCRVRPISRIIIWSRQPERAHSLAASVLKQIENVTVDVEFDPGRAASQACVVSCATPACAPLFLSEAVQPGTHVNAVGAFTKEMAELPEALLHRARVFVESAEAAAKEAGCLIRAQRQPDGEISDLLAGRLQGRSHPEQITVFKSVGIASQDVAAGVAALLGAEALAFA